MKHFSQRLCFFITVLSTLVIGSALMGSSAYAASAVPKTTTATKNVAQQQTININTADIEGLTRLKGVGEKKAQAIISYRDEHGAFQSIEELAEVKGIGEAIVNQNREAIVLK